MTTPIQLKLMDIIAEINRNGCADERRLMVLKKWLENPFRLAALGVWIARQAALHESAATGEAAELLAQARILLAGCDDPGAKPAWGEAARVRVRAREFQNDYQRHRWGPVRIIVNWDLLLIETGLEIYLDYRCTPREGYRLAADYCKRYDPACCHSLTRASRDRLLALCDFVGACESMGIGSVTVAPPRPGSERSGEGAA